MKSLRVLALAVTVGCAPRVASVELPPTSTAAVHSTTNVTSCRGDAVTIPAGAFTMRWHTEQSRVGAFCIDRSEVTVAAYGKCVDAGSCTPPREHDPSNAEWKRQAMCNWKHPDDRRNHPVNCVTWSQAASYCAFVRGRLPTTEEWEWVARSGDADWTYPWGNASPDVERASMNGGMTAPVGSLPKGDDRWGVHDLAGNVSEWTDSTLSRQSEHRIVRGGNFETKYVDYFAASTSDAAHPTMSDPTIGFRCAAGL